MIRMGMAGRGRLTGDGSPYLGIGLLRVGMSVPAHPLWVRGLACVWAMDEGFGR